MKALSISTVSSAWLLAGLLSGTPSLAEDSLEVPSLALRFDEPSTTPFGELPRWGLLVQSDQASGGGSSSASGSERIDKDGWLGLKAGGFWGTDDISQVDAAFSAEVVFGRYVLTRLLALEADIGYLYDNDKDGGVETTLNGVPFFFNARVGVPVLFLEPYAGVGVGGLYLHTVVDVGTDKATDDDVVLAGDVFAGLNFLIGRSLFVGAEFKYIFTDKADVGVNFTGYSLFACLGFRV